MATPLSKAISAGNATAVAAALDAGADPCAPNGAGHTPLDIAVAMGRPDIVKALATAVVRSPPAAAGAALSRSVVRSQHAVTNALLAAGAAPSWAEPGTGRTPLHWAAFDGDHTSVDALLAAGADAGAVDVTGATPADWAADRGHADLAARLRAAAAPRSLLDRLTSGAAVGSLLALAVGGVLAAKRSGPAAQRRRGVGGRR